MKKTAVVSAVAVGAVGIMALGACSSNNNSAEEDREASAASQSQAAKPSGNPVALPKGASNYFERVDVTNSDPSSCKTRQGADNMELIVECDNVGANLIGDQVFISVPNAKYRIEVDKLEVKGKKSKLQTTQRNVLGAPLHRSTDNHTVWNSPYAIDADGHWYLGLNALRGQDFGLSKFVAKVTYIGL